MIIYRNRVKQALEQSDVAFGTFVQIASPENAEIAAASGFDFIVLDMEHGSFGIESLVNMIRGVQIGGSTPVVRVPDDYETVIMKALDAGAVGLLIPGVSNAREAERVVRACRYAPKGNRGACPRVRATGHGFYPWEKHVKWSNENVMAWLLIETVEGFDNLEAILAVPGIDAVSFGAFDLSQSMGFSGKTDHPEVIERLEKAFALAVDRKIDIRIHLFETTPEEIKAAVKRWASLGARIFSCMTDRRILNLGFSETYSSLSSIRNDL